MITQLSGMDFSVGDWGKKLAAVAVFIFMLSAASVSFRAMTTREVATREAPAKSVKLRVLAYSLQGGKQANTNEARRPFGRWAAHGQLKIPGGKKAKKRLKSKVGAKKLK